MKVSSFLALKFLSGKGRGLLFSSLTYMAIFGVALSVAAFIIAQAFIAGLNKDIREKILGFSSHVVWQLDSRQAFDAGTWEKIRKDPEVTGIMHFAEGEAVIRTEDDKVQGVRVRGVDPDWGIPQSSLRVLFNEGQDWKSLQGSETEPPRVLLGRDLIDQLNLVAFLSNQVELLYPFGDVGPTGEMEPNVRQFHLGGRFHSGYPEFDNKFALVDLENARRLFGDAASEYVGIFLKDPFQAKVFVERHANIPGVQSVKTWEQMHRSLFQVLKMERAGMAIVLTLMILLTSFNILSLLIMLVFQRRRDFGVLKALGMTGKGLSQLVYRAGLWIGGAGGLLGILLGLATLLVLLRYPISLPAPYNIENLPVEWNGWVLLSTALLALAMSLLATWFPAFQSKKLNPVEAIRRE